MTVPPKPLRRAVERPSRPIVVWLAGLPRWVPPLVLALLLVGGLSAPAPVGVPLLVVVLVLLGWLSYLSWPVVGPRGRILRVVGVALIAGAIVSTILA